MHFEEKFSNGHGVVTVGFYRDIYRANLDSGVSDSHVERWSCDPRDTFDPLESINECTHKHQYPDSSGKYDLSYLATVWMYAHGVRMMWNTVRFRRASRQR